MTLRAPDARISPSVSSGQLSSTRVVATRRTGPLQWLKEAAGPPLLHRPRHLRMWRLIGNAPETLGKQRRTRLGEADERAALVQLQPALGDEIFRHLGLDILICSVADRARIARGSAAACPAALPKVGQDGPRQPSGNCRSERRTSCSPPNVPQSGCGRAPAPQSALE